MCPEPLPNSDEFIYESSLILRVFSYFGTVVGMSSTPRETSGTAGPAGSTLLRPDDGRPSGKRERTRLTLLIAAVDAIAEVGEAMTILDVTRRAGVSNGTFYNHFPDRDALVDAVASEVLATFTAHADQLVDIDDPALRFATVSALVFETATAFPKIAQVMLRLDDLLDAGPDSGDPFGFLRADLAEGARRGRFTSLSVDAAVDVAIGSMQRCVRRSFQADAPDDTAHRTAVLSLLLAALGLDADEATQIASEASATAAQLWAEAG